MDPDTGEILALASYPTYDLSTFNRDYGQLSNDEALPLYNRALYGLHLQAGSGGGGAVRGDY